MVRLKSLIGVIWLASAGSVSAVTPLSGRIYSNHQFQMADSLVELSSGGGDQWQSTPRRLAIDEGGTLVIPDTQGMMNGRGSVVAQWINANAGTVAIIQSISINAPHPADATQMYTWSQALAYSFVPVRNGLLTVDYTIVGASNRDSMVPESFLWFFNIGVDGLNDQVTVLDDDQGSVSATLTRPMLAGRRYEIDFGFVGYDDVFGASIVPFSGDFTGQFRWSIIEDSVTPPRPPIPEPALWGLMLAGFGLIGSAMRRQRRCLSPDPCCRLRSNEF